MRCPECEQRNSVAASKCKFCGTKLRKKQMSGVKKVVLAGALVLVGGAVALSVILPKLADPTESLKSCAKRVAAGPKSPEDAHRIKADLDGALKVALERFGDDSSNKLASRLQQVLPSAAFEVHVVDLPRGLKLVEIDTLLQASDFLVMKGTTETKVFPLPGFEVFDDARAVNDQAGPVLVMLGHTGGQLPHKPHVRTYALLPDFIVDETEKMVPMLKGEGSAKFTGSGADVVVDLSLASMAREEKIAFSSPLSPELTLRQNLRWKDARYVPEYDIGGDTNSYLFMLARCLARPDLLAVSKAVIGPEAEHMIKDRAGDGLGDVAVVATSSKRNSPSFALRGKGKEFLISLSRAGTKWEVGKYAFSQTAALAEAGTAPASGKTQSTGSLTDPAAAAGTAATTTAPLTAPESVVTTSPPSVAPQTISPASTPPAVAPVAVAPSVLRQVAPLAPSTAAKPAAVVSTPEPSAEERTATIASYLSSSSVRMRSRPATGSTTLTEIPRGAKIQILGRENGWYKASYGGQTGYVYGGLVDFKKPGARSGGSSGVYTTAVVTRSMTVRDERRRAMAHPQPGDRVVIVSGINKNNKYKVQLSDGRIGYLDKTAVDVKVETPEFVP